MSMLIKLWAFNTKRKRCTIFYSINSACMLTKAFLFISFFLYLLVTAYNVRKLWFRLRPAFNAEIWTMIQERVHVHTMERRRNRTKKRPIHTRLQSRIPSVSRASKTLRFLAPNLSNACLCTALDRKPSLS